MTNVQSVGDIKFVALSYVWRCTKDQVKITLDGESFAVTRNLYEALLQLRAWSKNRAFDEYLDMEDSDESAPWFWIDAICINQRDEVEKSKQVPRIGAIYSEADLVICWLGSLGNLDENAVRWIFSQSMRLARLLDTANDSENQRIAWTQARSEMGSYIENVKSCFLKIISRPWFTRIWTLQEAVLARQNPIFAVGEYMSSELASLWFILNAQHSQEPDFDFITGIVSHMELSDIDGLRRNMSKARTGNQAFERHRNATHEKAEYEKSRHESATVYNPLKR